MIQGNHQSLLWNVSGMCALGTYFALLELVCLIGGIDDELSNCVAFVYKTVIQALRTVPTNGKYFFPDNDYV